MDTLFHSPNEIPFYLTQKSERINRVEEFLNKNIIPLTKQYQGSGFYLEIGSGHGHWLNSFAQKHPEKLFIGIDLITKRVRKAESKKKNQDLHNLFFYKAEASEFIEAIPDKLSILSTYMMFPDPWPKKRHFKNRLIQENFLKALSKVSKRNSKFFFRTDHKGYFDWTKDLLSCSPFWEMSVEEWPHNACSFFQNLFDHSFTCTAKCL